MARGLGCVEYANGTRRYFVHCETTDGIFSRLFDAPAIAQATYRTLGVDGLSRFLCSNRQIEVVRVARLSGWDESGEHQWTFDTYDLASQDRLFWSIPDQFGTRRCLQSANGIVHVTEEYDGGFDGLHDAPLCLLRYADVGLKYQLDDKVDLIENWFGKCWHLCKRCTDALIS
jgi:hypothetical protein